MVEKGRRQRTAVQCAHCVREGSDCDARAECAIVALLVGAPSEPFAVLVQVRRVPAMR
jgi:hypothetical protein